jgi:hypothetical protein
LPYAAIWVDGLPEAEIPELRYRLRNFFHAHQEICPTGNDLASNHPSLLPYAERQWFTFSLDGGTFVACDALQNDFFRTQLPDHLKKQYFLLFQLALHQRFTLMMLADQVATHWLAGGNDSSIDRRSQAFERIRDTLLSFTARGYFAQVMQREHHHRCYRRWQQIFQVERLYQEVSNAVREMHAALLMQLAKEEAEREQKLERRLNQIALLLGVPALVLNYLNALAAVSWWSALLSGLASLALGGVLLWIMSRFRRNRKKS